MPPTLKIRILYAEDDPDTRDMLAVALGTEGFEVVCPEDLRDFLRLADEERWDVFLLDNWMPEISGVDLCKSIRSFDTETPIVFYSAAAYERDSTAALEAGAFSYIIKPIAIDDLISGLRAAVDSGNRSRDRSAK